MEMNAIPKQARHDDVIETADGLVVQVEGQIHTLNETAGEVYELCDGNRTLESIISEITACYQSDSGYDKSAITQHIRTFVEQLISAGLITL